MLIPTFCINTEEVLASIFVIRLVVPMPIFAGTISLFCISTSRKVDNPVVTFKLELDITDGNGTLPTFRVPLIVTSFPK